MHCLVLTMLNHFHVSQMLHFYCSYIREKASKKVIDDEVYYAGLLQQSKGLYKAALRDYTKALAIDPCHVPSLISTAVALRQIGDHSPGIVKSFLMEALRLDRTSASAWHNLGLVYKEEGASMEAAECFQAAILLQETEPIEPFR